MKKRLSKWTRMARYMAGEMEPKEEIDFTGRLERNLILQSELNQMEQSWKHINENSWHHKEDTAKAWNRLFERLGNDGLLDQQKTGGKSRSLRPALKFAASILLILAIGIPAGTISALKQYSLS